jgi:hypothetical protein
MMAVRFVGIKEFQRWGEATAQARRENSLQRAQGTSRKALFRQSQQARAGDALQRCIFTMR